MDETEDEKRTQGKERGGIVEWDSIAFLHFVEIEDLDFKSEDE